MKIIVTKHFFNQAKRLKKRFPDLKKDLIKSLKSFKPEKENHIGRSIYKIRIKSTNLQKGKSGGLRLYTYLYKTKKLLIPICIYSKSDKENLSLNELDHHFQKATQEITLVIS